MVGMSAYPHRCPECGAAAYLGFSLVDCSNPTCSHAGEAAKERARAGTSSSFRCWSASPTGQPCTGVVVTQGGTGTCPDCGSHYAVGSNAAA